MSPLSFQKMILLMGSLFFFKKEKELFCSGGEMIKKLPNSAVLFSFEVQNQKYYFQVVDEVQFSNPVPYTLFLS